MENALANLLSKGKGMAGNAVDALAGRAYQLYLKEAKANGEKPMSPEQFAKSQGKAN
jgi:hypothetical protein